MSRSVAHGFRWYARSIPPGPNAMFARRSIGIVTCFHQPGSHVCQCFCWPVTRPGVRAPGFAAHKTFSLSRPFCSLDPLLAPPTTRTSLTPGLLSLRPPGLTALFPLCAPTLPFAPNRRRLRSRSPAPPPPSLRLASLPLSPLLTYSLVVLCASSILLRPWCVGEMTKAQLHGVDTILLIFSDFRWPTNELVENHAQHLDGILPLAQYGINVGKAQEALRWLRTQPSIHLPQQLSLVTMDVVAGKLVSRQQGRYAFSGHRGIESRSVSHELATPNTISGSVATRHAEHYVQDLVDPVEMPTCRVAAIVDMADREAVCAALLFEEMLVHLLLNSWEQVPFIIPEDSDVPANVDVVLIVCTNGCFHSPPFVRQVLAADETGVHFIPVVAVEHFRFPVCGQITGFQGFGCMRQASTCPASSSSQQRRSDGNSPS